MATTYFRRDEFVKSVLGVAVPGSQVYVCLQPANVSTLPPSPLAPIFSDPNGLVPITQPILTDGFGHADFYAVAGLYTLVVGLGGVVQQVYPDQSLGGFGTAVPPGGSASSLVAGSGISIVGSVISATASGLPVGGTTGQVLQKLSSANFDVTWGTITGITLQTNGVANGSQTLLNLKAGSGMTLADNGLGQVTVTSQSVVFNRVQKTLSAAQMQNLTTTPVTLVSAPGLGQYLNPISITMEYVNAGVPFGSTGTLTFFYGSTNNTNFAFAPRNVQNFMDQVTSQIVNVAPYVTSASIGVAAATANNSAISIGNDAAAITSGTGASVIITVYYTLETIT